MRLVPLLTVLIIVLVSAWAFYGMEAVPKQIEVWPVQVRDDGIGGKIILLTDKDMKFYEQTFNQPVWIRR